MLAQMKTQAAGQFVPVALLPVAGGIGGWLSLGLSARRTTGWEMLEVFNRDLRELKQRGEVQSWEAV